MGSSCALSSISRIPEMYAYVCTVTIVMDNTARNSISLIKRIPISPGVPQDSWRSLYGEAYTSLQIRRNDKCRVNFSSSRSCKKNQRYQSYSETDTCSMRWKYLRLLRLTWLLLLRKSSSGDELNFLKRQYTCTNDISQIAKQWSDTDWKCHT